MDDAVGEFEEVAFADQHGPGLLQVASNGCGYGWHPVVPQPRGGGRARAGRIDQIFERDRYAMQRAAIVALRQFGLGAARLLQRRPLQYGDEAVEAPVQAT